MKQITSGCTGQGYHYTIKKEKIKSDNLLYIALRFLNITV